MDYEQVRTLLHETLRHMLQKVRGDPSSFSQFSSDMQAVHLISEVERRAKKQEHISGSQGLDRREQHYIFQAVWELIMQGVLIPNNAQSPNDGWPWVSFTDHGERVIFEERPTPYDPTGYLAQFSGSDDVVKFYVEEALGCYRTNRYTASTVMLGVASERLFDLLLESFAAAVASTTERRNLEAKTKTRTVAVRYDELRVRLEPKKSQLPTPLQDSLDTCLVSIFNLIRQHRNDSGHPTGRQMTRDEAYANLYVFPHYHAQMYKLVEHLRANPGSLS